MKFIYLMKLQYVGLSVSYNANNKLYNIELFRYFKCDIFEFYGIFKIMFRNFVTFWIIY